MRFDAAPRSGAAGRKVTDANKNISARLHPSPFDPQPGRLRRPVASHRLCVSVTLWPSFVTESRDMKRAIAIAILLLTATGLAQPKADVAAALKAVTPDLDQRLARFKAVKMPYNPAALTERERAMVDQLVIALRQIENMYWRQSDPEGLALYNALEGNKTALPQKPR